MDADLQRRWKRSQPPFDREVLLIDLEDDAMSPAARRVALLAICDVLHLAETDALWLNEDWHRHDGLVIASCRLGANESSRRGCPATGRSCKTARRLRADRQLSPRLRRSTNGVPRGIRTFCEPGKWLES